MTFERQRRVATFWPWLPVFRAAAEFESLQRASLALGLSVSAVSRAIKQLERLVGFAVLERHPTGVTVTAAGARLLSATRHSMRLLDDALENPLRLSIGAVEPAVLALAAQWLPPTELDGLHQLSSTEAPRSLEVGSVDLVLSLTPLRGNLVVVELGAIAWALATPPNGSAQRFEHPLDVHSQLIVAERRGESVILPRVLVPRRWSHRSSPDRTLFAAHRVGPAEPYRPVLEALKAALSGRTNSA